MPGKFAEGKSSQLNLLLNKFTSGKCTKRMPFCLLVSSLIINISLHTYHFTSILKPKKCRWKEMASRDRNHLHLFPGLFDQTIFMFILLFASYFVALQDRHIWGCGKNMCIICNGTQLDGVHRHKMGMWYVYLVP